MIEFSTSKLLLLQTFAASNLRVCLCGLRRPQRQLPKQRKQPNKRARKLTYMQTSLHACLHACTPTYIHVRSSTANARMSRHSIYNYMCASTVSFLSTTTGEATPRGPQTIPIFRTQNQGTRPDLMKTTSARQKALAKLKRADRNVLDASQC